MANDLVSWETVLAAFRNIWGYDNFRPPQGEIIQALIARQDALVILPTGGGKSICFQLPALLSSGLTLVISPLVALMENQVQELQARQLPAALLHGEVPSPAKRQTLKALTANQLRLLYLSPETLLSPPVWQRLCDPQVQLNGLILDEAHCLVQWGDTFRPAYRRLGTVRPALLQAHPQISSLTLAAFTATANPTAQKTLRTVLQLHSPKVVRLNPYRPNLHLSVQTIWTPRGRRQALLHYIRNHTNSSGLVYVRSRSDSESLAAWLAGKGFKTAAYHAGMSATERRHIEAAWLSNSLSFVISTNAFGMGVNKPDVRWVIHFHAPHLLSEYVQEVGRAGRDGQPAEAHTLISEPTGWINSEDKQRSQFFESKNRLLQQKAERLALQIPVEGEVMTIHQQFRDGAIALSWLHSMGQLEWLDPFHYRLLPNAQRQPQAGSEVSQMHTYLTTTQCRWRHLLEQFGFRTEAQGMECGHCDQCQRTRKKI